MKKDIISNYSIDVWIVSRQILRSISQNTYMAAKKTPQKQIQLIPNQMEPDYQNFYFKKQVMWKK